MGRKSNKERVEEILSKALTVADLISLLQELPQDAYVGAVGHFGEFYTICKYDVHYSPFTETYITPNTWRHDYKHWITGKVVQIYWPDIGPDPD